MIIRNIDMPEEQFFIGSRYPSPYTVNIHISEDDVLTTTVEQSGIPLPPVLAEKFWDTIISYEERLLSHRRPIFIETENAVRTVYDDYGKVTALARYQSEQKNLETIITSDEPLFFTSKSENILTPKAIYDIAKEKTKQFDIPSLLYDFATDLTLVTHPLAQELARLESAFNYTRNLINYTKDALQGSYFQPVLQELKADYRFLKTQISHIKMIQGLGELAGKISMAKTFFDDTGEFYADYGAIRQYEQDTALTTPTVVQKFVQKGKDLGRSAIEASVPIGLAYYAALGTGAALSAVVCPPSIIVAACSVGAGIATHRISRHAISQDRRNALALTQAEYLQSLEPYRPPKVEVKVSGTFNESARIMIPLSPFIFTTPHSPMFMETGPVLPLDFTAQPSIQLPPEPNIFTPSAPIDPINRAELFQDYPISRSIPITDSESPIPLFRGMDLFTQITRETLFQQPSTFHIDSRPYGVIQTYLSPTALSDEITSRQRVMSTLRNLGHTPINLSGPIPIRITPQELAIASQMYPPAPRDMPPDPVALRTGRTIPSIPQHGSISIENGRTNIKITYTPVVLAGAAVLAINELSGYRLGSLNTRLKNTFNDFRAAMSGEQPFISRWAEYPSEYRVRTIQELRKALLACKRKSSVSIAFIDDMLFALDPPHVGDEKLGRTIFESKIFRDFLTEMPHIQNLSSLKGRLSKTGQAREKYFQDLLSHGIDRLPELQRRYADRVETSILKAEYYLTHAKKDHASHQPDCFLNPRTFHEAANHINTEWINPKSEESFRTVVYRCKALKAEHIALEYQKRLCALPNASWNDQADLILALTKQGQEPAQFKPLLRIITEKYKPDEIVGIWYSFHKHSGHPEMTTQLIALSPAIGCKKEVSSFLFYKHTDQRKAANISAEKIVAFFQDQIQQRTPLSSTEQDFLFMTSTHLASQLLTELQNTPSMSLTEKEQKAKKLLHLSENIQYCGKTEEPKVAGKEKIKPKEKEKIQLGKNLQAQATIHLINIQQTQLDQYIKKHGEPSAQAKITSAISEINRLNQALRDIDPKNELWQSRKDLDSKELLKQLKIASLKKELADSQKKFQALTSHIEESPEKKEMSEEYHKKASQLCEEILRHDENDIETQLNYGKLQLSRENGDTKKAIDSFDKVIDSHLASETLSTQDETSLQEAAICKALILENQGNTKAAIQSLKKISQADKQLSLIEYELGQLYERSGKPLKARKRYGLAKRIDPNRPLNPTIFFKSSLAKARISFCHNDFDHCIHELQGSIQSIKVNEEKLIGQLSSLEKKIESKDDQTLSPAEKKKIEEIKQEIEIYSQQREILQNAKTKVNNYRSKIDLGCAIAVTNYILRDFFLYTLESQDPEVTKKRHAVVNFTSDAVGTGVDVWLQYSQSSTLDSFCESSRTTKSSFAGSFFFRTALSAGIHLRPLLESTCHKTFLDVWETTGRAYQASADMTNFYNTFFKAKSIKSMAGGLVLSSVNIGSSILLQYLRDQNCQRQSLYMLTYGTQHACALYSIISFKAALAGIPTYTFLKAFVLTHPYITIGALGVAGYTAYQNAKREVFNAKLRERDRLTQESKYEEALRINQELIQTELYAYERSSMLSLLSEERHLELLEKEETLKELGKSGVKTKELIYKQIELCRDRDLKARRYKQVEENCRACLDKKLDINTQQRTLYQLGKALEGQALLDDAIHVFQSMEDDWTVKLQLFALFESLGSTGMATQYAEEGIALLEKELTEASQALDQLEKDRWKFKGLTDKVYSALSFLGSWRPKTIFRGIEAVEKKKEEMEQIKTKIQRIQDEQEAADQRSKARWEKAKAEAVISILSGSIKIIIQLVRDIITSEQSVEQTYVPDESMTYSRFSREPSARESDLARMSRYQHLRGLTSMATPTSELTSMSRYALFTPTSHAPSKSMGRTPRITRR